MPVRSTSAAQPKGLKSTLSPIANYDRILSSVNVVTCKLPHALDGCLADLARRRGVSKSVLVREAIEAKIAEEAAAPRRQAASLIEVLGDSVGSIASGKRDLARNKKHLQSYGDTGPQWFACESELSP